MWRRFWSGGRDAVTRLRWRDVLVAVRGVRWSTLRAAVSGATWRAAWRAATGLAWRILWSSRRRKGAVSLLTIAALGTLLLPLAFDLIDVVGGTSIPTPDRDAYLERISRPDSHGADHPLLFPSGVSSRTWPVPREDTDNSATCGQAGCHPDVTRQWSGSLHHLASFNNPFYTKAVQYTRERQGDAGVRWCAGCHDPVLLLSGEINADVGPVTPGADAGITCVVCHATVAVRDLTGNGRYVVDVPHTGRLREDAGGYWLVKRILPVVPQFHRRTFLKPLHKQAELCSSCHRVGLTPTQNAFHWLRGQDQFGSWQDGGASGRVARAFHLPLEARRCQDCHMPRVASQDAGHDEGWIRSHAFPGANTAVPGLVGLEAQVEATEALLKDSMRVDLFSVREYEGGDRQADHRWLAPLEEARLTAGTLIALDVVVRNVSVGHGFPEGVLDNKDVWLEVVARDVAGREVWRQGGIGADGELLRSAHVYTSILLDAEGNRIDKRNVFDQRVTLFSRQIPAGASDVARYRFRVPSGTGGALTLEARLRYRKVRADYTRWAWAGRRSAGTPAPPMGAPYETGRFEIDPAVRVPELPIVEVAADTVTVGVDDPEGRPSATARGARGVIAPLDRLPVPPQPRRSTPLEERWYDYGVAFLRQRDTDRARRTFSRLVELAPGYEAGYVGLGWVALQAGDPAGALEKLQLALERAGRRLLREKTDVARRGVFRVKALLGQAFLENGDYPRAVELFREVLQAFPQDRSLWSDLGYALFQQDGLEEALEAYETVLELDPDDAGAHGMLARIHQARGWSEEARLEQQIFEALREEVATQGLRQKYLARHPEDALEANLAHEHEIGIAGARGM